MSNINLLCAFCGHPLDDEAIEIFASASSGCDTCGPMTEVETKIYCRNEDCPKFNKVIYSKEE